jgi:hypothetical protein
MVIRLIDLGFKKGITCVSPKIERKDETKRLSLVKSQINWQTKITSGFNPASEKLKGKDLCFMMTSPALY